MIIGGGRHAVEIFYLLEDLGLRSKVRAFIQDEAAENQKLLNVPILKKEAVVTNDFTSEERPYLIGAIGNIRDNKRLIEDFKEARFSFFSAIVPSVVQSRQRFLGDGIAIAQGVVLSCNVFIDDHSMINIGCTLSHDVTVGKYVNMSPGTHIAGYVTIEDEVFIGTGVTIVPRVTVGKGAYIAAGACITKDVPSYSMVAGVPGTIKRKLN